MILKVVLHYGHSNSNHVTPHLYNPFKRILTEALSPSNAALACWCLDRGKVANCGNPPHSPLRRFWGMQDDGKVSCVHCFCTDYKTAKIPRPLWAKTSDSREIALQNNPSFLVCPQLSSSRLKGHGLHDQNDSLKSSLQSHPHQRQLE